MDLNGNEAWIGTAIVGIAGVLFGRSGILQKLIDSTFKSKKKKEERLIEETKARDERIAEEIRARDSRIEDEIRARETRIKELQDEIRAMSNTMDSLKDRITHLDRDLIKTTTYVKTLLAYLETLMPEGATPFITELAKEIRKDHTATNE